MKSLRSKLVLMMLAATIPALIITVALIAFPVAHTLKSDAEGNLKRIAQALSSQVREWEDENVRVLLSFATDPGVRSMNPETQQAKLDALIKIYTIPYLIHTTDTTGRNIARSDRKPPQQYGDRLYFREAMSGKPVSTELIISRTTNLPSLAISVPIRDFSSNVVGTAGLFTSLATLSQQVNAIKLGGSGYAMLVDSEGKLIAHPDRELATRLEKMMYLPPVASAVSKKEGFLEFRNSVDGKQYWSYALPLANGWGVVVMQQSDELLANTRAFIIRSAALLLAVSVLMSLLVYAAGTRLLRPVADLTAATRKIAQGNYESRVPITTEDELGRLGAAFNQMSADLGQSIADLEKTTAAKEKIESEIKIAREIQTSLLPMIFPAFPSRPEFDLHAVMEAAREVGGDFYDFYFLNDYSLSFVIGDVSDKGIPAALFMAVTKTLLKASSDVDLPPDHIVRTVNRELALENKAMNFVTLFYGIYDLQTGVVQYCNAGHNPPFILRAGQPVETLAIGLSGLPLGVDVDTEYSTETLQLSPGDQLVLYTDGVTEAQNTVQDFYGTDRFRTLLEAMRNADPFTINRTVIKSLQAFAAGAPQSDDITLVSLRIRSLQPADPSAP